MDQHMSYTKRSMSTLMTPCTNGIIKYIMIVYGNYLTTRRPTSYPQEVCTISSLMTRMFILMIPRHMKTITGTKMME